MKIIDEHVHIGTLGRFDMRPEQVIQSMERYGIAYSLVSSGTAVEYDESQNPLPEDWPYDQYSANMETVSFARAYEGRIGVLPWCRPHTGGFNEAFIRLLDEGGDLIKGLKFHPCHSRLPVTSPRMEPYFACAAERNLPVLVHTADDAFSQPRFV